MLSLTSAMYGPLPGMEVSIIHQNDIEKIALTSHSISIVKEWRCRVTREGIVLYQVPPSEHKY